jgi:N-acetylglucosaminyl-diphospho-decaprenol L-rhamnosyltransferase
LIDVVTVAYRSDDCLRDCVEPLVGDPEINVVVVDNACPNKSADTVADLDVRILTMPRNVGFAAGCNAGAATGKGDVILFLNPDATMSAADVRRLGTLFAEDPSCGALGPHILESNGEDQPSMRRLPRLGTAFGEALFVQQLLPRAAWTTEIVRTGYDGPAESEWLSGAVLSVRRSAFEAVGGFDERFFMYCEDIDLCARISAAGYSVKYDPSPTATHAGGGSAPRPLQAAQRAEARVLYARLHEQGARYAGFRIAFVLHELLRLPLGALRSRSHLRGRLSALSVTLKSRPRRSASGPASVDPNEVEVQSLG